MPGKTGENLLSILERRLDNVVYRLGFAASRKEARQLVRHGHYTLNGKKANIPSILVKAGDVVSVAEGSRNSDKIKLVTEANASRPVPQWLDADKNQLIAVELNDLLLFDVHIHILAGGQADNLSGQLVLTNVSLGRYSTLKADLRREMNGQNYRA